MNVVSNWNYSWSCWKCWCIHIVMPLHAHKSSEAHKGSK